MLHGLNGLLNAAVGDTVSVMIGARAKSAKSYSLIATPGVGTVSQFGNLPPIAGLVKEARIPSSSPNGCVGLIAFNIWLPMLVPELEQAIDKVRTCDGVVVDLRGNPGGVGAMVMGFGGYFVDSTRSLGTMKSRQVSLRFVINPRTSRDDGRNVRPFAGPLAILVDPMTASTSEIFATGMQRIGRARVFGETSAGAALPALMERLPSGDVFVHAVADFTDPLGRRIEGAGAVPDEIVPLKVSDLTAGRDAPLDAAVKWIVGKKQ
jgi:carboxyl-terminal processing protease